MATQSKVEWIRILALLIALAAAIIWLTSCSSRHVQKSQAKQTEQISESSSTKAHTEDHSVITETKTTAADITVPGTKLQSESTGVTTRLVVDGDTLEATYDPGKNVTKAAFKSQPKKVPVQETTTKTVQNDIHQDTELKKDSTAKTTSETSSKEVEKKNGIPWWIWLLGILALLAAGWKYRKKILKYFAL